MKEKCFALVDCNNFFVSCERVFQPKLNNLPVVVLSNNDGCIISRSAEAKALDIPMGAPFFKWQKFLQQHKVQVVSSNYKLYGEMSARVMQVLEQFAQNMEIYSIDEAFLDLTNIPAGQVEDYARQIRSTVLQWTGIPVSVGIGATKTLAKVANYRAKKTPEAGGVLSLMHNKAEILKTVPIEEIWGVGRALTPRLNRIGIYTAQDLAQADSEMIRSKFTITGLHTLKELRGQLCYELGELPPAPKSLICSRSFRAPRTTYAEMAQAVSSFVEKASERMRKDGMTAKFLTVHISTNRFDPNSYYANSHTVTLPIATNNTLKLIKFGLDALKQIYQDNRQYKRAGVLFTGLIMANAVVPTLFSDEDTAITQRLMTTLDKINQNHSQVYVASSGKAGVVGSDRFWVSPNYLTSWKELPLAKAE